MSSKVDDILLLFLYLELVNHWKRDPSDVFLLGFDVRAPPPTELYDPIISVLYLYFVLIPGSQTCFSEQEAGITCDKYCSHVIGRSSNVEHIFQQTCTIFCGFQH